MTALLEKCDSLLSRAEDKRKAEEIAAEKKLAANWKSYRELLLRECFGKSTATDPAKLLDLLADLAIDAEFVAADLTRLFRCYKMHAELVPGLQNASERSAELGPKLIAAREELKKLEAEGTGATADYRSFDHQLFAVSQDCKQSQHLFEGDRYRPTPIGIASDDFVKSFKMTSIPKVAPKLPEAIDPALVGKVMGFTYTPYPNQQVMIEIQTVAETEPTHAKKS